MPAQSSFDDLRANAGQLRGGWRDWPHPLALVDNCDANGAFDLPPFPLIGLSAAAGPVVDAIVEPPVSLERLVRSIFAAPNAAAVLAGVLRTLSELPPRQGLELESLAMATLQASEEHAAWLARQPVAPPSEPGAVRLERVGDVLNVVLDRPTAHNAIDRFMRDQLFEAFELAALDADIKRVRLSGEGRSFSVGADLTEFGTTRDAAAGHLIRRRTLPASTLLQVAEKVEAHVNGACIGAGLEIAAFAKQVNASANSWFQLPELAMGIMPGAGGCVSLSRRIGRQRTALLALSGARIGARVALAWGLIDAIVDD